MQQGVTFEMHKAVDGVTASVSYAGTLGRNLLRVTTPDGGFARASLIPLGVPNARLFDIGATRRTQASISPASTVARKVFEGTGVSVIIHCNRKCGPTGLKTSSSGQRSPMRTRSTTCPIFSIWQDHLRCRRTAACEASGDPRRMMSCSGFRVTAHGRFQRRGLSIGRGTWRGSIRHNPDSRSPSIQPLTRIVTAILRTG